MPVAAPLRFPFFVAALAWAAAPLAAQTTWTATSGNWTTGSNWSTGSAPPKSSSFNDVVFNADGVSSNLNENWTVRNVTLNAGSGAGLTISQSGGSALSFFEFTANATATVSANLHLLPQAFDTARTFNVASGRTLTLSGVISGDGSSQSMFEKTGAGTVVLSGSSANTFGSDLRIFAGTVRLEKSSGEAVVTNVVINNGGTLRLGASHQISDTRPVTINSGGTFDLAGFTETVGVLTLNAGGTLTDSVGGSVLGITATPVLVAGSDLSFRLRFDASGIDFNVPDGPVTDDLALSGVLSGAHGFTKSGAGQLKLAGADANTFTGATTVNAGTLLLVKSPGTAANDYGAAIGGDLTINSGGTVRLGASDQHNDTKLLHVAGGTLDLNGFNEGVGTGGLRLTGGTVSGAGTFNLFGDVTTLASATTATLASSIALGSGTRTFEVADGSAVYDVVVTGAISGSGGITKTGAGTLALNGTAPHTFSGATTVEAGTLLLALPAGGPGNNYGGALRGPLTIAAGGLVQLGASDQHDDTQLLSILGGTLQLAGNNEGTGSGGIMMQGGQIVGSGMFNLGSGLTTLAASSTATIASTVFLLNGTRTLDVADGAAATDLAISGAISGGGLVKAGAGTLALSGANTFADGLTLNAGRLDINSSSALGAGPVTLAGGTLAPSASLTHSGAIAITGAAAIDTAAVSTTLNGDISGAGSLTLSGSSGTFLLGGANTLAGGFTLHGGTVVPGHDSAFGSGALTLAGGTLGASVSRALANAVVVTSASSVNVSASTLTLSGVLSGSGALTKSGAGTLALAGTATNTYTGAFTVAAGTLQLGKPAGGVANNYGSALRGDLTVNSGATVRLGASDQHDDTKLLHVAGGTLDLNGFSEGTSHELRLTGGTVTGGTFNLLGALTTVASSTTASVPANLNLFAGTRAVTVADGGAATDLALSGATTNGTFTKSGSGLLSLSGTTDNASLVGTITAGTVVLEKSSSATVHALGGGAHTVAAGATLRLGGTGGDQIHDPATLALAGTFDLAGRSEAIAALTGAGTVLNTGAAATLSLGGDTSATFSGVFSGSTVSLAKLGTGTLTLAGSANNSGLSATVFAGTLELAKTSASGINALGGGTHTVASGATLRLAGTGGDQILDNAALNLAGTFDLNGRSETIGGLGGTGAVTGFSATQALTVGGGNASATFSGTLTAAADSLPLVKTGTGTQTLAGAADNAFLRATVSAGTLELAKTSSATVHALGGGTHTVASGGTLKLAGTGGDQIFDSAVVSIATGGTFDLNGRSETIATFTGGGSIVSTGGSATLTIGFGGLSETFSGAFTTDNVALGKTGTGTLTLAGSSSNSGQLRLQIEEGTVELAKASSPIVYALGTGTHTVGAGGTLRLAGTGGNQIFDQAIVSVATGGTFDLNGRSERIQGLEGAGNVTGFSATSALTLGGSPTPASVSFSGTLNSAADALPLIKAGPTTQILAGTADNAALRATVSGGTLELAKTSSATVHALGGGTHTVAAGATLKLAGTGGDQIFDDSTLDLAGTLDLNGRSETIGTLGGTGTVTTTGGAATLTLGGFNVSGTVTALLATDGLTLGKTGTGTLTLGGTADNAFLVVNVGAGTLELAKPSSATVHAVGSGATVAAGATLRLAGTGGDQIFDPAGVTVNGTFDLAGRSETIGTLAGSGTVRTDGGAATLTVGHNNGSAEFSGTLVASDGLALTKIGTGTQTISGGALAVPATVSAGTLRAGAAGVIGSGPITLGGSGTLDLNGFAATAAVTGSGAIALGAGTLTLTTPSGLTLSGLTGSGGLVKNGAAELTLTGSGASMTGATVVNAGTLRLEKTAGDSGNNFGGALRGPLTINAGATVVVATADQHDNTQPLTLDGGTLQINGVNEGLGATAFTGGTVSGTGIMTLVGDITTHASATTSSLAPTLSIAGTRTLTVADGAAAIDFALTGTVQNGAFIKAGAGLLQLSGSADNSGLVANITAGTVVLAKTSSASVHALGSDSAVSAGATLRLGGTGGDQIFDAASLTVNGTFALAGRAETIAALHGSGTVVGEAAGAQLTVGSNNASSTYAGTLTDGGGPLALTKTGTGTLTLTGTPGHTGGTQIEAGTLAFDLVSGATLSGPVSGSGTLVKAGTGTLTLGGMNPFSGATQVQSGTLAVTGSFGSSAVSLASGATLTGTGSVGALTVAGRVSPGASPGTLTAASATFAPGGSYRWEINNAAGTAGGASGWDLLSISGALAISATSANPFRVDLVSLTALNAAGAAANFNPATDYSFNFVTAQGGISGFAASAFTIDTSGFSNAFGGSWAVVQAGNSLAVNYSLSAIPEPSTYAALAGAAALGLALWQRRRRRA